MAPRLVTVQTLNRTFRSHCIAPFFSEEERTAHRSEHGNKLTPTFGFEAIVHALYACDHVRWQWRVGLCAGCGLAQLRIVVSGGGRGG